MEIQAGLFPTQLHSQTIRGESEISFMQLFGLTEGHSKEALYSTLDVSTNYVKDTIFDKHTNDSLKILEAKMQQQSTAPITTHLAKGHGWGALELLRLEKEGIPIVVPSMTFPMDSLESEQNYWLSLLNGTNIDTKECDLNQVTPSYMVDGVWLHYLDQAMDASTDVQERHLLNKALIYSEGYEDNQALSLLIDHVTLSSTALYLRTVAALYYKLERYNDALIYYEKAYRKLSQVTTPYLAIDLINEYLMLLFELNHYDDIWTIYKTRIDGCEEITEEMFLSIAQAAFELKKFKELDQILRDARPERIREANNILCELWFKRKAITLGDVSLDEVRRSYSLPENIDFRMT